MLVNGVPLGAQPGNRTLFFDPDGPGFVRLTVIDARGAADSVMMRMTDEDDVGKWEVKPAGLRHDTERSEQEIPLRMQHDRQRRRAAAPTAPAQDQSERKAGDQVIPRAVVV